MDESRKQKKNVSKKAAKKAKEKHSMRDDGKQPDDSNDRHIEELLDPHNPRRLKMEPYEADFKCDEFYCLDGGFGTSLRQFHAADVDNDPLWSCRALKTDPDAVVKTHEAFLRAGANIITTNTYQAHHELFLKHIEDFETPCLDSHLLMEEAVKLADKAVRNVTGNGRNTLNLVAGSVGPYGACLGDGSEYTGNYLDTVSREDLSRWHRNRIARLNFGKPVSVLAIETMPSYVEALAILDLLDDKEFDGLRCWVSFQCKDDAHTARGEPIEEAFRQLAEHDMFYKVRAVGVNCVKPSQVSGLLKRLNSVNHWSAWPEREFFDRLPYVVYPNGGEDWDPVAKRWVGYAAEGEDIVSKVKEWMVLGANAVGGCCRVGPRTIAKINVELLSNIYDVVNERAVAEEATRNAYHDWPNVCKRLQRPSHDEERKRMQEVKAHLKGFGDDVSPHAYMQAQLECMMASHNKELLQAMKAINLNEFKPTESKDDVTMEKDD